MNGQSAAKPRTEEGSTTIPMSGFGKANKVRYKIKVEILNIQINRSTAQSQMESVKIR